jgi:hypothetical protein
LWAGAGKWAREARVKWARGYNVDADSFEDIRVDERRGNSRN